MGLKYSTAKTIWKIYKDEGRINRKARTKNKVETVNQEKVTELGDPEQAITLPIFSIPLTVHFIKPDFWAIMLTQHCCAL